jgi:hypothetical protein
MAKHEDKPEPRTLYLPYLRPSPIPNKPLQHQLFGTLTWCPLNQRPAPTSAQRMVRNRVTGLMVNSLNHEVRVSYAPQRETC